MPEDLGLGCLFPLMTGLGAFTLWGLGWAIGCSPGQPLTPWSSRCRKDLIHLVHALSRASQAESGSAKMDGGIGW